MKVGVRDHACILHFPCSYYALLSTFTKLRYESLSFVAGIACCAKCVGHPSHRKRLSSTICTRSDRTREIPNAPDVIADADDMMRNLKGPLL